MSIARGIGCTAFALAVALLAAWSMAAAARVDLFPQQGNYVAIRAAIFWGAPIAGLAAIFAFYRWLKRDGPE